jgi:hypothetical protein
MEGSCMVPAMVVLEVHRVLFLVDNESRVALLRRRTPDPLNRHEKSSIKLKPKSHICMLLDNAMLPSAQGWHMLNLSSQHQTGLGTHASDAQCAISPQQYKSFVRTDGWG